MGLMDWLQSLDLDPMKLVGDSPILQEPTPQQPQVLSPTEWLAQKQSQEQAQQQMSADMYTPEVATPATAQAENRVLTPQEWLAQQPNRPIENPINLENTTNLAYKVGSALKEPASMALEALSYLDKPRAAIAGAVQAMQDDTPVLEGAKQGWEQNTSWKETFPDEYVKEHPTRAAVTGLGWDIAFDPLWLAPPAKVGSLVGKASKAIGLTDNVINPAVKAIADTETGQKVTALAEDIAGKNRVADEAFDYNAARSTDQLQADDLLQNVKSLKKEFGEDANKLTDYIEASPKAVDTTSDYAKIEKDINAPWSMTQEKFINNKPYNVEVKKSNGRYTAYTPDGQSYVMGFVNGDEFYILGADTARAVRKQGRFSAEQQALAKQILKDHPEVTKITSNITGPEAMEARKRFKSTTFKEDIGSGGPLATTDIMEMAGYKSAKKLAEHRGAVEQALKDGKKVPDEVLIEYPDLFKQYDTSTNIINSVKNGTIFSKIINGEITKPQAFNALRDAGEEIPDQLLQTHQRQFNLISKELEKNAELFMNAQKGSSPETIKQYSNKINELMVLGRNQYGNNFDAMIKEKLMPDTITRESILNAIPNPALRKAIENLGETFISRNKANSERLKATGRLSDEQYVSYLDGEHLRRSFDQYENPDKFLEVLRKNGTDEEYRRVYQSLSKSKAPGSQGFGANHKVDMKDFVQRQTLSDETMGKLGLIKDPEYRIMDTLNRSSKTLREDEYLDRVATVWGKSGDEAADLSRTLPKRRQYVEIPKSESYGTLAGKWLPKDVAEQVIKVTNTGASSSELVQGWQKLVSWFKVSKLANPASTMRNFYSGIPMANVFGGLPMQQMPKYMAKATMALKQGNKNPLMREVKGTGILGNVWQKQELKNIIGENPTGIKYLAEKRMNAFGKPDEFWRVATYAFHRDQGKSVKEAAQIANKAMFDYSNAPEWINTMSRNGIVPFAKFPFFAGKATLKAAYENPAQLSKFVKPQNQVNNEDREKIMPDYMKSKTLLPLWDSSRTVNGKEQPVQNNLDLSYILPFASDVKFGNPLIDAVVMSRTGKNGLGQQVIKPGMTPTEEMKEWGKFAYNAVGPSLPLPGNYAGQKLYDGYKGNVDSKGRQYDLPSAALQTLLGLKNVPINTEELYKQKVTALTSEQRNVTAMINLIKKDKSLSNEQRKERIADHQSQLKELVSQLKETNQAWQRIKKKG